MPKDPASRSRVRLLQHALTAKRRVTSRTTTKFESSKQRIREYLGTLDQEMAARQYLAGDYSVADITRIPFFCRLERYRTTIDDSTPHVKAWMNRVLARRMVRSSP